MFIRDVTSELLFCGAAVSSPVCPSLLFLQEPSVLHFPLQLFSSPLARAWRRFRNFVFQARKSAWTLPLRLFTTLQSPSPLVMIRMPLSIQSHLSMFLPTWLGKQKTRGLTFKSGFSSFILFTKKSIWWGTRQHCSFGYSLKKNLRSELNIKIITSYCIIVSNINRVAESKHSISEAFQVGLPESKVSGRLFQPLAKPLSIFCWLSVSVGGHKENTHRLVGALNEEINKQKEDNEMSSYVIFWKWKMHVFTNFKLW